MPREDEPDGRARRVKSVTKLEARSWQRLGRRSLDATADLGALWWRRWRISEVAARGHEKPGGGANASRASRRVRANERRGERAK